MAQKTAWNAATLTEADINLYLMGEGGAWASWTPVVTQSVTVAVTNTRSRFARYGRTIVATTTLTVTGAGTAANSITISLPVTAAHSSGRPGVGTWFDTSATNFFEFHAAFASTTTINLRGTATNVLAALGSTGSDNAAALANGDVLEFTITYEAAS